MAHFTVTAIIDGDTFAVTPAWQWGAQTGHRVRPGGYDATEFGTSGGEQARAALQRLLQGQSVTLDSPYRVDRGRLVCEVYLAGRRLADYFS